MTALQEYLRVSNRRLIDVFREWDADGSGALDLEEFISQISSLERIEELHLSKAEWKTIQKQLDVNSDRGISFKEFNNCLNQYAGKAAEIALLRRRQAAGKQLVSEVLSSVNTQLECTNTDFRASYDDWLKKRKT